MEIGHYHFRVSVGDRRSGGRIDAPLKYEYNSRSGRYSSLNEARNRRHHGGEHLLHVASGNLPTWSAHDAGIFWRASQEFERKNGTQFREFEGSLPRGLVLEQQIALVKNFIAEHFTTHVFSFAIHAKIQSDGLPAEHAHIQISERVLDGIERDPQHFFRRYNAKNPNSGGCKKDSMGTPERLECFRASWAQHCNNALAATGRPERVDHRSYRDRGIDLIPEKKLAGKSKRSLPATKRQEILAAREARRAFLVAHVHIRSLLEQSIMQNTFNYIKNGPSSNVNYISSGQTTDSGASDNVIYITPQLSHRVKLLQHEVEQLAAQPTESNALLLAHRLQSLAYEIQGVRPIPRRRRARHGQTDSDFDALTLLIEAIRQMINIILLRLGLGAIPPLFTEQTSHANVLPRGPASQPETAAGKRHESGEQVDKPGTSHESPRCANAHNLVDIQIGQFPAYKRLVAQRKALSAREAEATALTRLYEARLAQASVIAQPAIAGEVKRSRLAELAVRRKLLAVEGKLATLREQLRSEVEHEIPTETAQSTEDHVERRYLRKQLQTQIDELDQHEQPDQKDSHGPRPL